MSTMTKAELNLDIDMDVFRTACQNIIDNSDSKAVNYAVAGARTGVRARDMHTAYNLSLRLVGNITAWRGPVAGLTRA